MKNGIITLSGIPEVTITLSAEAHLLKASALEAARKIDVVDDEATQEQAAAALSNISGLLKKLEATRTEVKSPVLDLGRQIDTLAKQFAAQLNEEKARLTDAVPAHFRREKAKADMERRMLEAMAEKKRKQAEEDARKLDEERRKLEAAALNAKTEERARELDAQAKAAAEKAEAQKEEAASIMAPVVAPPAKADKMVARPTWKHQVTDLVALHKARPELVTLEPKTNAINAEVRGGMRECPGLRIWEETDVTVRA